MGAGARSLELKTKRKLAAGWNRLLTRRTRMRDRQSKHLRQFVLVKKFEIDYMIKQLIVLIICVVITGSLAAQSDRIGFGFRAGASISKLDGPLETGPDGEALEEYKMANGFHLGAAFTYRATDLFGMRAELLFSQRGTIYNYNGPSYYVLGRYEVLNRVLSGTRSQTINVSNVFLDIPITAYYKFGSFEIMGGVNTGVLLASTAGGSTDFAGISGLGAPVDPFEVKLNHNYKKDKAMGASETLITVSVDGLPYTVPETVMAYYEFETKDKNWYNTFDFGLVVGAALYINEGLYLSARYVHGIGDVDQNTYDVSLQSLNQDGSFIYRNDKNESRNWQFSVGFSF